MKIFNKELSNEDMVKVFTTCVNSKYALFAFSRVHVDLVIDLLSYFTEVNYGRDFISELSQYDTQQIENQLNDLIEAQTFKYKGYEYILDGSYTRKWWMKAECEGELIFVDTANDVLQHCIDIFREFNFTTELMSDAKANLIPPIELETLNTIFEGIRYYCINDGEMMPSIHNRIVQEVYDAIK